MSIPDTTVKVFRWNMTGAPQISSTAAGQLLPVLDACLVNGFGEKSVSSLVVANGVATLTVSDGHGLSMLSTDPALGPVIKITGAEPSALNREWRLASVPSSTQCTFNVGSIPDGTATGTIAMRRAGLGWTNPFSATNIKVYRNDATTGTGIYLRVDNTATDGNARPQTFWTMTDANTGVYGSSQPYWRYKNSSDPSNWIIIGDHRAFFFLTTMISSGSPRYFFGYFAGDLVNSAVPGDARNYLLMGANSNSTDAPPIFARSSQSGTNNVVAGAANQADGPVFPFLATQEATGGLSGSQNSAFDFANLPGSSIVMSQMLVGSNGVFRGHIPGLFHSLSKSHNQGADYYFSLPNDQTVFWLKMMQGYSNAQCSVVFDVSGPWR